MKKERIFDDKDQLNVYISKQNSLVFIKILSYSDRDFMNIIIEEIRKKNRKVYKNFFDKNYADLVTYANGYLFDQQASEDLVQEVFIYIWENAKKIKIKSSLKGYVATMVRNRCLNYLKSIKITDSFHYLELNIHLITEHVFDSTEEDEKKIVYHQILKIVDTLPEKMQKVVRLKFLHNYTYAEIAEELNISINTVKTHLKRAKVAITELITSLLILLEINQ
ncbi:RNA polymerase sigma-70 factor [Flavivirga abyssicola]|uniref:RNA polymerase sigma factor n=1 Tax=Flavivirga abyssicola TaxID=3063533 RepID=UPI0026E110CB|nr:RNA polymerase sigma-70 factor [Flavivirga sp. MEBiC07777]WVK12631.1 RNA polymerase sigma-70 factor [Flavivirga sp. MEBiC07777]